MPPRSSPQSHGVELLRLERLTVLRLAGERAGTQTDQTGSAADQGPPGHPGRLDLDSPHSEYLAPGKGLREAREAFEKDLIQRALTKHRGNISSHSV